MPIDSISAQQQGSAAAKKERRALEAAQAMRDYEATRVAIRAKTERLRAARLAKEVGDLAPQKKGTTRTVREKYAVSASYASCLINRHVHVFQEF